MQIECQAGGARLAFGHWATFSVFKRAHTQPMNVHHIRRNAENRRRACIFFSCGQKTMNNKLWKRRIYSTLLESTDKMFFVPLHDVFVSRRGRKTNRSSIFFFSSLCVIYFIFDSIGRRAMLSTFRGGAARNGNSIVRHMYK